MPSGNAGSGGWRTMGGKVWTCRHCAHWRYIWIAHGRCGLGHYAGGVKDPARDCRDFSREPGADDDLEGPQEATGGPVGDLRDGGAIHG